MRSVLGFIVLAFGLAACAVDADTTEDTTLSTVPAEVSVAEPEGASAIDEASSSLGCVQVWECRQCSPFRTQNILVDACTREITKVRPCGEECF